MEMLCFWLVICIKCLALFKKPIDFLNNAVLVSESNGVEFGNIYIFSCVLYYLLLHIVLWIHLFLLQIQTLFKMWSLAYENLNYK